MLTCPFQRVLGEQAVPKPIATACARDPAPSFAYTALRCDVTVSTDTHSLFAICLFESPSETVKEIRSARTFGSPARRHRTPTSSSPARRGHRAPCGTSSGAYSNPRVVGHANTAITLSIGV
jgi:hypothetical protein